MNKDPKFWRMEKAFEAPLIAWLSVHGNLCLALRHPWNRGPSREYVVWFVKALGRWLVNQGAMTWEELQACEKLEAEEGTREFERRGPRGS